MEVLPMAYQIGSGCVSCGACADVCPVGAISQGDDHYVIDANSCFMPSPAWTAVLAAIPAPMALSALLNNYIARTKNTGADAPVFFCRLAPEALPVVQYYQ